MLIDTHSHISDRAFDADRAAVLARAAEAGVTAMVDVGIDLESSRRALACAEAHPQVHAAVGVHPHEGDGVDAATIDALRALARGSRRVVAVGETGLDFYRNRSTREGQVHSLRLHMALARELSLPLILHLRSSANAGPGATDAYETMIALLREEGAGLRGVSHCFSGTVALGEAFVALGFDVSFAGNATYPAAQVLRDAARALPLERIVVETDCPYLAPQGRRGKRNEPALVRETAEALAKARGMPLADFAAATTANARRLFGIAGAAS
jgi:TatD DNase family protein